mmetsp:Transcript_14848/g.29665  ORF Transcript_14848/g.29665 Transcript_14848/m.29665 type:complete len:178 (-) Transcript_14848:309-842(-)
MTMKLGLGNDPKSALRRRNNCALDPPLSSGSRAFLPPPDALSATKTPTEDRPPKLGEALVAIVMFFVVTLTFLHFALMDVHGGHAARHLNLHVSRASPGLRAAVAAGPCQDHRFLEDNYCDCTFDGSDEHTTSACSDVTVGIEVFRCKNGERVFASRVRDGIKDCSDGSDEVAFLSD